MNLKMRRLSPNFMDYPKPSQITYNQQLGQLLSPAAFYHILVVHKEEYLEELHTGSAPSSQQLLAEHAVFSILKNEQMR